MAWSLQLPKNSSWKCSPDTAPLTSSWSMSFRPSQQGPVGLGPHLVQNALIAHLRLPPLGGIALAVTEAEQLFKHVLQVELAAPAKALGKGHGYGVAVVDVGEGVGVHRVLHVAADHPGEAVHGQHGPLAGAAAGDDIVRRAAVQQQRTQNAALDVGELGLVVGGVHAVVVYSVAHGLHHFFQRRQDNAVLCRLAVFVDECDFHS